MVEYKKLSELCEILDSKRKPISKKDRISGSYPYYGATGVLDYVDNYIFDEPLILVGEDGAKWGSGEQTAYKIEGKSWVNNHAHVIRPDRAKVVDNYLLYFFNQLDLTPYITGAIIEKLNQEKLRNIIVPLPCIKEQQRIVNILDKAEEIRTKKKLANEKLDEFLKSTFIDMFGDPEFNNKNWEKVVIRDVVKDVKYGTSSKAGLTGTYPILRMGNLTYNGAIVLDDLKYIDLKESEIDKYTVHKGDILFNRTNSKELVGKTAVYRGTNTVAFAGYLVRVRTNNLAHYEFLSAFMNSSYMKKKLQMKCKNIVGMANINAQEFQDFDIYLPPIDLQNQFAQIVQKVEAQKEKNQKVIEQMDNLFNSLMQQAFKGKI